MENNQRLIPQSIVEAVLEDVISSDFEKEIAMTRIRRISSEFSSFGFRGVRSDL